MNMYVDEIWSLEVNGPSESNPLNCLLVFGNFWKDRLCRDYEQIPILLSRNLWNTRSSWMTPYLPESLGCFSSLLKQ